MEFELDQAGTELFDNEDENWDKDDSCQSNGNGMDSSYPTDESNKKKSDQAPVDASHQASHTINENSQEPKLSLNEFHRVTLKTFSKNPKTTMGYRTHLDRSAKCPTNSEGMTPITDDGELLKKVTLSVLTLCGFLSLNFNPFSFRFYDPVMEGNLLSEPKYLFTIGSIRKII